MKIPKIFLTIILSWAPLAIAEETNPSPTAPTKTEQANSSLTNQANNPLSPQSGLQFQNYYAPSLYNVDGHTNSFFLRSVTHIPANEYIKVPQILRIEVPVETVPSLPGGGYTTGLDNIQIFDIFILKQKPFELGLGPILVLPTAANKHIAQDEWQAGVAGIFSYQRPEYMVVGLFQYQQSFEKEDGHAKISTATMQPVLFYNLPHQLYLRSSGIWNFNLENGDYFIPVGLGLGKVWKSGDGTIYNLFVEPQPTVSHDGAGAPKFQLFFGLSLLFK